MLLKHRHILEARQYGDGKVILCYIKIGSRFIKYYSGQPAAHRTQHWMRAEDWARFDEYLEFIVCNHQLIAKGRFKEQTCQLSDSISVYTRKCGISIDRLKRSILEDSDEWNVTHVLEFRIEYIQDKKPNQERANSTEKLLPTLKTNEGDSEYNPSCISNGMVTDAYVPYIPLKINNTDKVAVNSIFSTPGDKISRRLRNEDHYIPKPITVDRSIMENNESSQVVPTYNPSPLKTYESKCKIRSVSPHARNDNNEKDIIRRGEKKIKKGNEIQSNERDNITIRERRKIFKNEGNALAEVKDKSPKEKNGKEKENIQTHDTFIDLHADAETDSSRVTLKDLKRRRNLINESKDALRSPFKYEGLARDQMDDLKNPLNRSRSKSTSPKRQNKKVKSYLFPSEYCNKDDDDGQRKSKKKSIQKNVQKVNEPVSLSSTKIVSNVEKTPTISLPNKNKWLEKKRTTDTPPSTSPIFSTSLLTTHKLPDVGESINNDKKRKRREKPSQSETSSCPMKTEIEMQMQKDKLQIENNQKVKEVLQRLAGPKPQKVDTLTIEDLTLKDVLNSFVKYKPKLDEIFHKNEKKPHQIKGYNGIDHYLVMDLINEKKRMAMLNTLQDNYEPDLQGSSAFATLFINAMMPEWIIRLFMDKHKLSRKEAIKQVKAQDEYNLHLEAQLESCEQFE